MPSIPARVLQLAMTGVLRPSDISAVTGLRRSEIEEIINRNPDVKKYMRTALRSGMNFPLTGPFWEEEA